MYRRGPLFIIQSLNTVFTAIGICHTSSVASVLRMTSLADSQQIQLDKYLLRVYSVEIPLMMDSVPVRNMYSTLSNTVEKLSVS